MTEYINPVILQRADPYIYKHSDGYYYFSASVPEYDRIELRRAKTINGLAHAAPRTVWRKHATPGAMDNLIWAPEIHWINDAWYIYFEAESTVFNSEGGEDHPHRMFCISSMLADPMDASGWVEKGQIETPIDSFSLDETVFEFEDKLMMVWAQKDPAIEGSSNLYIAEMKNPWTIKGDPVMISTPTFDWEKHRFAVNEGPAVLIRNGKVFITFSASATDENYCVGLLYADETSNLLDASSWTKLDHPVFKSDEATNQYGPGHNSFTKSEDDQQDLFVYHCRDYKDIQGDPLYDPNRHTKVQAFSWDENGLPVFGKPVPYNYD
ncbi:glycoside hydrolase family 43 protein [Lentilactobacillus sp. Marseille-Q4993]|uniref:glycoside hydrolase family 43 protein n=1 Tax=Lentilactobacillus sp. Marseille-Q4993 TaxID=3039492 RepID=UPI0024BC9879|nr:glycoside hydrolase family 43 protein [Lentilactobacillus sp. Marseille-Q4993]